MEDEIDMYLNMKTLSETADPLEHLRLGCNGGTVDGSWVPPRFSAAMAHVFREGLSVCAHSCDTERMFRNGRLTLSDLRQGMSPSTFQHIMFVNGNQDRLKDVAAFKAALKKELGKPAKKY